MPQEVFNCIMHFYADLPRLTRYTHLTRAGLTCAGYNYLALRTVTTSAHHAAVLQCALRLLLVACRRDNVHDEVAYTRLYRREDRALQLIPALDANSHVLYRIRQLVHSHQVVTAVMDGLLRQFPQIRAAAARLLSRGRAQYQEDATSSESDGLDQDD